MQHAASDVHWRDFAFEKALLLSARSALLAQKRVFVLRLAIHFVSFGDYFRSISHHHVNSRHSLQQSRMRVVVPRNHADAFHSAADRRIDALADDLVGGYGDRLQTGGAETVDSGALNRCGKSGKHGGSARYVLALCAMRLRAAENHVFNLFDVQLRSLGEHVFNAMGGQIFGTRQVKRSSEGFGKGRPRTGNYYCFSHVLSGCRNEVTYLRMFFDNSLWLQPANGKLGCHALFFAELGESFSLFRKPLQQRGGLPYLAVLALELRDALVNFFEANRVGIPHWAPAICGEPVAIQINNVDVRSTQRVAFFQNACAFIDQGIDAAIHDFLGGDLTLRNSRLGDPLADEFINSRIRARATLVIIFVPPSPGFLPESAELAKIVFRERLANSRNFQVAIFLADAPTNIEAREVADGQRSHGIAEVDQRLVHGFYARALFDKELCFASVRTKHAVADEASAVADEHPDFAQRF